jgi:DNA polymerase III epsilon subunit-like protein
MKSNHDQVGNQDEIYISVDIEAAGPIPGEYSLLSIGACLIDSLEEGFYVELQPLNDKFIPEALKVSGLSLNLLKAHGHPPVEAMDRFRNWALEAAVRGKPVFVGFNASFDWAFVNWYFHMFLGENPFGFGALDIKSFYMGLSGCRWSDTSSNRLPGALQPSHPQTHNALEDAKAQAEIFEKLLAASREDRAWTTRGDKL